MLDLIFCTHMLHTHSTTTTALRRAPRYSSERTHNSSTDTDRKADTIGGLKHSLRGAEPQACCGGSLAETEADPGGCPSSVCFLQAGQAT